jgi:hypothetical protein
MGGVVKGAFNAVKSVVKYGVNMVKSVIKNPLPTILTIGLNFVAPGISSFTGLSQWAVKGIGRAAISAANGGSLAGIVAAGITPYFNSPTFQNTMVGGLLKDASSFISAPIKNLLGDNWVSNVVSSSLTDSSVAGLIAAVSGQDIMKAMGSEFVTSAVTAGIGKAWDALKTEVPKLLQTEEQINQKALDAKIMKDTTPVIGKVQSLQYSINKNVTEANQLIDEYNEIEKKATVAYDRASLAETQEDYDRDIEVYKSYEKDLNDRANIINQLYVPSINEEKAILEAEYNNPESKGLIDEYISKLDEVGQLNKSYELGVGKVLAENADFRMTDAISKGNFTEASKFYNELETYNKQILSLDPNAIAVAPSLNLNSQNLLKDIYSATDETLKNQLISQANLNQQFTDIRTNVPPIVTPTTPAEPETPAPVEPTPTEPTVPETPTPVEPTIPVAPTPVEPTPVTPVVPETPITDDRAPGYGDLPTLPESGIGQPTPSVPTTPTTPTTPPLGTGSNIINNIIGGAGNMLENALIGGATNAVVNEILGNEPPKRPTINKPRPPAKADVGTLRPYTGSLFGQSTTPTTPTTPVGGLPTTPPSKVDPSILTPYTGSLSFLGQTTPPTNTTTQTPSGGLQSNQTQTPPTKVDVSRLTPVTDTNLLKSLGIA